MLSRFCIIFFAFLSLLATVSESKLLMFDDFEEAKLNKKKWAHGVQANKISWKIKNGHLEVLPIGGGAGGAAAFGYGLVESENFGLQFDFQPLHDDFDNGSWTGILFRASKDFNFYQLYITPADGIGTKNYARWYIRNGGENTWKELKELRTKLPFDLISKQWYTLTLTGKIFNFQLYLKKREEAISQKVMDWTDTEGLHPKGTIGFIADNSRHYYVDNLRLFDAPKEVNLSIEPIGKVSTIWGKVKEHYK